MYIPYSHSCLNGNQKIKITQPILMRIKCYLDNYLHCYLFIEPVIMCVCLLNSYSRKNHEQNISGNNSPR